MHGVCTHARFDDLDLDARSQWLGRGNISALKCTHARFRGLDLDARSQWLRRGNISRIISTTKQVIQIILAATLNDDNFYFNLKFSILNYGHTSISCKTHVRSLVIECCMLSELVFGDVKKN